MCKLQNCTRTDTNGDKFTKMSAEVHRPLDPEVLALQVCDLKVASNETTLQKWGKNTMQRVKEAGKRP